MYRLRMLILGLVVCGAFCIGVFCGCEDGPDMENVDSQFDNSSTTVGTSGTTSPLMVVTPSSASLTSNGEVVAFTLEGASGTVTWSVQDISKGSILTQSDLAATYQRAAAGDNVVIVTDSGGTVVFATVSQP